jgi:hypothetical protein
MISAARHVYIDSTAEKIIIIIIYITTAILSQIITRSKSTHKKCIGMNLTKTAFQSWTPFEFPKCRIGTAFLIFDPNNLARKKWHPPSIIRSIIADHQKSYSFILLYSIFSIYYSAMENEVSHYVVTAHPPGSVLATLKCYFTSSEVEVGIFAQSLIYLCLLFFYDAHSFFSYSLLKGRIDCEIPSLGNSTMETRNLGFNLDITDSRSHYRHDGLAFLGTATVRLFSHGTLSVCGDWI